jgi:hypothetical protein
MGNRGLGGGGAEQGRYVDRSTPPCHWRTLSTWATARHHFIADNPNRSMKVNAGCIAPSRELVELIGPNAHGQQA